ncbi:unnamed protein product [Trichogramma brassicae]|uniref:RNA-directed DNA polymerase n=1 Tax=Trichogramma brassicae TaxID=86971 RepID=A0A6H5HYM2_9HYME|nr:unnamed protein product [Trichogramma brassicae]
MKEVCVAGCKRRKRRRASATRGRRHAESTALAKLASRGRQPVSLPIRPRSSIRSPTARKVGNWSYRQRKERESCATLTHHTSAGHLGIEKTFDRVKREYYWRACITTCTNTFARCDTCQRYKIDQTGPRGLMGRRVIERPWSVIACDLMEFSAQQKPKQSI